MDGPERQTNFITLELFTGLPKSLKKEATAYILFPWQPLAPVNPAYKNVIASETYCIVNKSLCFGSNRKGFWTHCVDLSVTELIKVSVFGKNLTGAAVRL